MPVTLNKQDNQKVHTVIIGVAVSLVIPVCAWLIDLIAGHHAFNLRSFITIHVSHPSLFFIDLIPIASGYTI